MASKLLVLKNIKIIGLSLNGALILHAEDDICDFFKDTNLIKHNLKTGEKYFLVNIKNKLEDSINDPYSIYKGIFNGDNITVELFSTKVSQSHGFVYKLYYLSSEIPPDISNNIKYQIVGEPTEDEKKAAANKIWNICKESPAMGNAVMDLIGDDAYMKIIGYKED